MTRTTYEAKITAIIDEATGGTFEYPESFDSVVEACFLNRMSPEAAASSLMSNYAAE